jgi:hypothetical protein
MKIGFLLLAILIAYSGVSNAQLSNAKFDVEVELVYLNVSNVKDLDGIEDLYGKILLDKQTSARSKTLTSSLDFWNEGGALTGGGTYPPGKYNINKKIKIFTGLTFDELKNIILYAGGKLYDDEGYPFNLEFKCFECSAVTNLRRLSFMEYTSTQNSINALVVNIKPQALKFGADNLFELNYYENGIKENGLATFFWRVWVTPYY